MKTLDSKIMKKIFSIIILLFWILVIFINQLYIKAIYDAVKNGFYEEIYGPLSFFHPYVIIFFSIIIFINVIISFKK